MKVKYRVHRVSRNSFPQRLMMKDGVEVEAVPVDHMGGTLHLRFVGDEAEEVAKTVHRGDFMEAPLTFTPAPAA
jgi:hypothetical protein